MAAAEQARESALEESGVAGECLIASVRLSLYEGWGAIMILTRRERSPERMVAQTKERAE